MDEDNKQPQVSDYQQRSTGQQASGGQGYYFQEPELNAAVSPPQDPSRTWQELQQTRQELARVRHELEEARLQLNHLQELGSSAAGKLSSSSVHQVLALEQLGKTLLEQNAKPGSSLEQIIGDYLLGVEKLHPHMRCACMRLDGDKLYTIAAPSLPQGFSQALDGTSIGERVGSCGTAAFLGQKIIATDIAQDPRWVDYKDLALACGIRASWSFPVFWTTGEVLGTLAIYYNQVKAPTPQEQASLESISSLLQLILENKLSEKALRDSNERFHFAALATHDAIYDWNITSEQIAWGGGFEKILKCPLQRSTPP